jgi:hypothetical protein
MTDKIVDHEFLKTVNFEENQSRPLPGTQDSLTGGC